LRTGIRATLGAALLLLLLLLAPENLVLEVDNLVRVRGVVCLRRRLNLVEFVVSSLLLWI
jgi:hypothetical protein